MIEIVRRLLQEHGRLHAPVDTLPANADLYDAGLTPFAAIRIMLALEEEFGVQFPVSMLRRQSFAKMESIVACLAELRPDLADDKRQAA